MRRSVNRSKGRETELNTVIKRQLSLHTIIEDAQYYVSCCHEAQDKVKQGFLISCSP